MWSLDAGAAGGTFADNTLVIVLAKPAISEEESRWKKGQMKLDTVLTVNAVLAVWRIKLSILPVVSLN